MTAAHPGMDAVERGGDRDSSATGTDLAVPGGATVVACSAPTGWRTFAW
jgi:hypothetical protein